MDELSARALGISSGGMKIDPRIFERPPDNTIVDINGDLWVRQWYVPGYIVWQKIDGTTGYSLYE